MKEILNKQKLNWCWTVRLFYTFKDGSIYEATHLFKKNGYDYWSKVTESLGEPIARFIVRSKVDKVASFGSGPLKYRPTELFPNQLPK